MANIEFKKIDQYIQNSLKEDVVAPGETGAEWYERQKKIHRDRTIAMYLQFRKELDKMCVPKILEQSEIVNTIEYDGKVVGMICGSRAYIDCLYIYPKYRRKGLGKKAALDYVRGRQHYGIKLHIINNNEVAKKFWNSIFELQEIEHNDIDTLYMVVGIK